MRIRALKKAVLVVLFSVITIVAFADKKVANAVAMVSYEQGWLDNGIIALKNNTDKDIHNVSFRLVYFDMSGNQLDYMDFNKRINIAPGMTRQIEVEGYGRGRQYSYYKSKECPGNPHRFKIDFRLTGYNNTKIVAKSAASRESAVATVDTFGVVDTVGGTVDTVSSAIDDTVDYDSEYEDAPSFVGNGMMMLGIIMIVLLATGISVGLYVLVAVMARKRNRSMVTWVFVSIITTPLLAIIILLCIGDAYDSYR